MEEDIPQLNKQKKIKSLASSNISYNEQLDVTRKLYPTPDKNSATHIDISTEENPDDASKTSNLLSENESSQFDYTDEPTANNSRSRKEFFIECEITFIHTDEVII